MRALAFVTVLALSAPAAADTPSYFGTPDPEPEPVAVDDGLAPGSGFAFGLGLGLGGVASSDENVADGAGGHLSVRLGGSVGPDTLLLAQLSMNRREVDGMNAGFSEVQLIDTVSVLAQHYVARQLWLKAGGGFGQFLILPNLGESRSREGFGLSVSGGYDLWAFAPFTIDVELNATTLRTVDGSILAVGIDVGVNLY